MLLPTAERHRAGSRILVQRDVYDEFVERYAAQAKRVKVGYPHDPATEVGAPRTLSIAKVMSYVEIGKGEVPGRRRRAAEAFPRATSSPPPSSPTFSDARIFQEEIFGPVVAITPFDTDEK